MDDDQTWGQPLSAKLRSVFGLWGGLALVGAGFVAVAAGWNEAASTPDVRVQLQALISGGLGGVAMVVGGGFLVLAHLTEYGFRRLEGRLDGVTEALLELAHADSGDGSVKTGSVKTGRVSGAEPFAPRLEVVEATHASYHAPGCDLIEDQQAVRSLAIDQARDEGLSPCKVCVGELVQS